MSQGRGALRSWLADRDQRLILDAVLLGAVGAASGWVFLSLLEFARLFLLDGIGGYGASAGAGHWGVLQEWRIPIVTTLGGLLSGLLVYGVAPEAEGHGTDAVVRAFHRSGGRLRARIPPVKMIASAITIGSGGAAGREGPTALIAAGIGSLYGNWHRRTDDERRLLLLMAMAAGLSAVFRSPIGTAVFAVEVLYAEMEFDAPALIHTLISSVVAYALIGFYSGWEPLFRVPSNLGVASPADYIWYTLLGVAAGIVATAIPAIFYGMRDLFGRLPMPRALKPALGGLGVGLLAMRMPQVLGGGYDWIQSAIDGQLALFTLAALLVGKTLAFSLTISSGGSGGVFAPTLYVGAMLGAFIAQAFGRPPAAFAVIGMAAVFAGAARVPIASLLMVTEMTGGYHLLAPAGLAVASSYLIQRALSAGSKYPSLYEAQVASPVESPAHHERLLRDAFHLLTLRGVALPGDLDHLQLIPLLRAGVPLDLADGQQLHLGALAAASPWVGRSLSETATARRQVEVVAVLRAEHLHLPDPRLVLEAGDRLLFLATSEEWESIRRSMAGAADAASGGSDDGLGKETGQ